MKTGANGLALIKRFEGIRLRSYLCPANVPTIGYGHTKGVLMGIGCTSEEADKWLVEDLEDAERAVNRGIVVPLSQNQFDALVSFAFNLGESALWSSTLRKKLNEGKSTEAADQFLRWNKAKGLVLEGLVKRREAERRLFLTPDVDKFSVEAV